MHKALLLRVVEELQASLDNYEIPGANCSCHISPPCSNCIEVGDATHVEEELAKTLAECKALLNREGVNTLKATIAPAIEGTA